LAADVHATTHFMFYREQFGSAHHKTGSKQIVYDQSNRVDRPYNGGIYRI